MGFLILTAILWPIAYMLLRAGRNKTTAYMEDEHSGLLERIIYKFKHAFAAFMFAMFGSFMIFTVLGIK